MLSTKKPASPGEGIAGFDSDAAGQWNAIIESPSLWMVPIISERISAPSAAFRVNFTLY